MIFNELNKVFKDAGITGYHLKSPENATYPFIVYKCVENNEGFSDDEDDFISYYVYLNLICVEKRTETANKLKKALKENNFVKRDIQSPYFLEKNSKESNQAFDYIYFTENK